MSKYTIPENMYFKSVRYQLFPTDDQITFFNKCFDVKRFVWNWALEQEQLQLELHRENPDIPSFIYRYDLEKRFTELRNQNDFLKEVPHNTARNAIKALIRSYHYYFIGVNKAPKFRKKKSEYNPSFHTREDRMYIRDNYLQIEGLGKDSYIKMKAHTCYVGSREEKFFNAVISKDNIGRYWITFNILEEKPLKYFDNNNIPKSEVLGIDLNVKKRCVLSNGQVFYAPDISRISSKIKRAQHKCTNDIKRYKLQHPEITNLEDLDEEPILSNRAFKRKIKYRKLNDKLHNIEMNNMYNIVKKIIDLNPAKIVLEDLTNRKHPKYISKQIAHANFYTIRKIIERKADLFGIPVLIAPKEYPSSQICSNCGSIRNIGSRKTYICKKCGLRIDRDLNAAINLRALAEA